MVACDSYSKLSSVGHDRVFFLPFVRLILNNLIAISESVLNWA